MTAAQRTHHVTLSQGSSMDKFGRNLVFAVGCKLWLKIRSMAVKLESLKMKSQNIALYLDE